TQRRACPPRGGARGLLRIPYPRPQPCYLAPGGRCSASLHRLPGQSQRGPPQTAPPPPPSARAPKAAIGPVEGAGAPQGRQERGAVSGPPPVRDHRGGGRISPCLAACRL